MTKDGRDIHSRKSGLEPKMFDMNLELAMDVDENMKPGVLELVSQKQTDIKYLRVRQDLCST
jgi:hypothetical protein